MWCKKHIVSAFSNLSNFRGDSSLATWLTRHRFERSAWAQTHATSNGDLGKRRNGAGNERTNCSIPHHEHRDRSRALRSATRNTGASGTRNGCPSRNPSASSSSCATWRGDPTLRKQRPTSAFDRKRLKRDCIGHGGCCGNRWTVAGVELEGCVSLCRRALCPHHRSRARSGWRIVAVLLDGPLGRFAASNTCGIDESTKPGSPAETFGDRPRVREQLRLQPTVM